MLLTPILLAQTAPRTLETHIAEAVVFRPGFTYLVREATIPAGVNTYRLGPIPEALDGSFWYDSPDGARISDIHTILQLNRKDEKVQATSIPEYLVANVGKTVRMTLSDPRGREHVAGKLLSYHPANGTGTLLLGSGALRAFNLQEVLELDTKGLSSNVGAKTMSPRIDIVFRTDASKTARVRFYSLESGAAWVASYLVDVGDHGATLTSKAQLGLGPISMDSTRVRLMTGLPNLNPAGRLDLSTGLTSLLSYLAGASTVQAGLPRRMDPYEEIQNGAPAVTYEPYYRYGVGGGFGGGGMGGPGAAANIPPQPQFSPPTEVARLEDLHSYDIGPVTLPAGGRLTRQLDQVHADSRRAYTWDTVGPVQSALVLKNVGKDPWPTGAAFVVRDRVPLSQMELKFTPAGQEASIPLGVAQDIATTANGQELSREPIVLRDGRRGFRATVRYDYSVTNTRSDAVDLVVSHDVPGEVQSAEGAATTRRPPDGSSNVVTQVTWSFHLAPMESRSFHVIYVTEFPA